MLADQAMSDASAASDQAMHAAAHAEATDYLAKTSSGACQALADATVKDVENNIKAEQDILNKIDKGANCPNEGQQAVATMEGKLKKAQNDHTAAVKAHNDA